MSKNLKACALATMALVQAPNLTFDQQYDSLEEALREAQLAGIRIGLDAASKQCEKFADDCCTDHGAVVARSCVRRINAIDPASLMEKG